MISGRGLYRSVWNMMMLSEPPSAVANACVTGYLPHHESIPTISGIPTTDVLFQVCLDDSISNVDDTSVPQDLALLERVCA